MTARIVDEEITLIPYYPNAEVTYPWYQDKALCRQVDNIGHTYSLERLNAMYAYLSTHGACYYISYRGILVGDVTLKDDTEVAIVVSREYQNRHIGRRCLKEILKLAKEKGMSQVRAEIYSFNSQSRRMFLSAGFLPQGEERFVYPLGQDAEKGNYTQKEGDTHGK